MLTLAGRLILAGAAFKGRSGLVMTASYGTYDAGHEVALCPDGGTVLAGSGNNTTGVLIKVGISGAVLWKRQTSGVTEFSGVCVDPSTGDIYVTGGGPSGARGIYVLKYSAAGVMQWQRRLEHSSAYGGVARCRLDGAGGLLVSGLFTTSPWVGVLAKYNTSGVFQWGRVISNTYAVTLRGLAVDGSGNAFVVGDWDNAGTLRGILRKYNSSGALQSELQVYSGISGLHAATLDASGNVYLGGYLTPSSQMAFQAKLNSALALQWGRTAAGQAQTNSVALDPSGNVLCGGPLNIIKRNNAGDLVMQRSLKFWRTDAGIFDDVPVMAMAGTSDALFAAGTGRGVYLAKFPANGTGTGNYGGMTLYAESTNITSALVSPTISATTLTDAAGLTDSSSAITDYAASLSVNFYVKTA